MSVSEFMPDTSTVDARFAHVGLGKTASTFLQKRFFSGMGIPVYSTDPSSYWPSELNWLRSINQVWMEDFYSSKNYWSREQRESNFFAQVRKGQHHWAALGKEFVEKHEGAFLLSAEGLVGFSTPAARYMAELLHDIGMNKIIFVFRNQADWSISLWRQLILAEDRFARYVSYEDLFGDMAKEELEAPIDMNWWQYLKVYEEIFGKENVLAIPYELMVEDAASFFDDISRFMNYEPESMPDFRVRDNLTKQDDVYVAWRMDNCSLCARSYKVRRLAHKVKRPWLPFVFTSLPVPEMSEALRFKLQKRFARSNRDLSAQTGLDLSLYGYY